MGDAVDHVGGAGTAGRQADAGTAGDVAPGRGQHGAGHLLLHEQEAHLALAGRLHQLDRLAARMADDKRRTGILEGAREHFNGRRHETPRIVAPASYGGKQGVRKLRQARTVSAPPMAGTRSPRSADKPSTGAPLTRLKADPQCPPASAPPRRPRVWPPQRRRAASRRPRTGSRPPAPTAIRYR